MILKNTKANIRIIFFLVVAIFIGEFAVAQNVVLNNGKNRIGNGAENSINTSGNMQQPFYFNTSFGLWRKLTYSSYPLDIRWGVGGDGTNDWNINGNMVSNPMVSNITFDYSGFITTNAVTGDGYGVVKFTGNITLDGKLFLIENTFSLGQVDGYLAMKVKITNVSGFSSSNVRLWVGTRDDYVGTDDGPLEERGNLVNGAFQLIANSADQAKAIKISTANEAVLFFSDSDRAYTTINSCCNFTNSTNQNPATNVISQLGDGSYAMFVRFNDLAPGESDELEWYYAAGSAADIDDIIADVATASGAVSNISYNSADYTYTASESGTTSYILVPSGSTVPTALQVEAGLDYPGGIVLSSATIATAADVNDVFNLTGLTNNSPYDLYAVTSYTSNMSILFTDVQNANFSTLANDVPVGSVIANHSECINASVTGLVLSISDAFPGDDTFTVTATSSNTSIVADADIVITGTVNTRLFVITPVLNAVGTSTITVSIEDSLGAIGTQTFDLTFSDLVAPVADVMSLTNVTSDCEVTSLVAPTATDNCAGMVTVTNNAVLPITTQGTTLVTWTYDDGNGNTSTQTQNVVINDVTAPVVVSGSVTLTPPTGSTVGWSPWVWQFTDPIPVGATVIGIDVDYTAVDHGWGGTGANSNIFVAGQLIGSGQLFHTPNTFNLSYSGPVSGYNYGGSNALEMYFVGYAGWRADWLSGTVTIYYTGLPLTDVTAECSVTSLVAPTATDNCAATVIVTNDAMLPITTQGTTVVTWTYDDGNGNTSTQIQNVIIDDVTAPTPDGPAFDVITECEVLVLVAPTATDNCTNATVTVTNDAILPIVGNGITVVTWTYDDGNGNTSTQTQNVIIDDVTAPTPNVVALADVTGECSVIILVAPTATDNCTNAIVTATNDATLPIVGNGTTLVTWTYDDGNGNTSTQTQNVIIDDVTAPTPDVPALADVTAECEVTSLVAPTGTDNCVATVIVTNDVTLPITTQGTTLVTWTYDDGNGNTSTQTQNVIIDDLTAPTPDGPALDVTAECEILFLVAPTATDNCTNAMVTVTNNATLPITGEGATIVVTWTYDDGNGNTATQTQNVIIDDVTAPTPDVPVLADVTADCEVTSLVAPTATDNCAGMVTVTNNAVLPITTQGTTLVTWTYDDGNGNTSSQDQNFIIDDVTAPTPEVPALADVTAECEVTSLVAPTGTDNCVATVIATNDVTLPITTQGTTVVTWTYDDGNGNMSTQTQNVILDDVTDPVFTACPAAIIQVNDSGDCGAVVNYTPPTATDNCSSGEQISQMSNSTNSFIGNARGYSFTVPVNMTITSLKVPTSVSTSPQSIQVMRFANSIPTFSAMGNYSELLFYTSMDANDNFIPVNISLNAGDEIGILGVRGNSNAYVQDSNIQIDGINVPITRFGTQNPIENAPAPQGSFWTETSNSKSAVDFTYQLAAVTLVSITQTQGLTSGSTFPVGTTTNTFTATDAAGNTSTCSFDVTITDSEAPMPDLAVLSDITAACEVTSLTAPTATDNCATTVTVTNDAMLPISGEGMTTVVTWTYDDGNGNTATQAQNVIIDDVTAPTPDVPVLADVTAECEVTVLVAPTATDNCTNAMVSVTNDATLPITGEGTTATVTWTYDDGNGNTSTQTQNIIIDDFTVPVADIAMLADVTAECEVTMLTAPTATDNCTNATVSVTNDAMLPITTQGTTVVTWTYDDGNGNTSTQTQNVVIDDVTPPVAVCQDITVELDSNGQATIVTEDIISRTSYTVNQTGTFAPVLGIGTLITLGDDQLSSPLQVGFDFNFFGTDYGQFYISSNGFITFTPTSSGCCTGRTIPDSTDLNSLIAFSWDDLNPTQGGTIDYFTTGTAPNRKLIVNFIDIQRYGGGSPVTVQTILYENSGLIEMHTTNMTNDGGSNTQGIENIDGSLGVATPGRNAVGWSATNDYVSFTPRDGITDNCGVASTAIDITSFDCTNLGTNVVTLTVTDVNGNVSTCQSTVTVEDNLAPVPDLVTLEEVTSECEVSVLVAPTATDNCSLTITNDAILPITGEGTTTVVTWTYDDGNGNTSTQTQNVVIDDVTAPVADVSVLVDVTAECSVASLVAPTATDNCAGVVTVTTTAVLPISGEGTTTVVTWTYDDGNGNTSTQDQNVVIDDVTAPVADVSVLADVTAECSVTSLVAPTATDNCVGVVTVTTTAVLPISGEGTTTVVTWTYDDGNGNTSTQTQNVIIDDVTAPTPDVAALADVTAVCDVTMLTAPTATDNCTNATVSVTNDAMLPITTQGTTVVTWTYDDGNGNTSTQTQNVVIDDVTAPVADAATLPDLVFNCEVTALTVPTATDNCAGTVTGTATFPITSTTVVEWIFDDGNGNVSTQDQTIIIERRAIDAISAVLICDSFTLPAITGNFLTGNQMYYTESGGTGLAFAAATTLNFADFTSYPVTLYAYDIDVVGCSDEVSFTLTINETPVITAIADVTACDQYTLPALMVGNYYSFPAGNGTLLVAGTTINTTQTLFVYAIDGSGNCTDEDSFVVTITPLEDASFNYGMTTYCPNGIDPTPSITGLSGGNFTAGAGLVIDSVTGVVDLDGSALGSYVITYTTNGSCAQSTTATIIIQDTSAPSPDVTALTDLVFNCEVGSLTAPTATDNCAGTIVGTTITIFPITSTTTVTWTYDDGNGNQSVQNLLVIIESTSVDAIANIVECDSFTLPVITGDFLTGNQMYYTQSGGAGLAFAEATIINFADFVSYPVTLYAYDTNAAGCSSETSFQVTLTQTPVIGTIADVTICDEYTLPTLAVGDYYTFPGGTGTLINAGTVLTDTQTLFVYVQDVSGACTDEESLVVTITETDIAGATLANESFTYDGTTQSLTVGNIPASATVVYTNNDQVDAGTYQVTATIRSSTASCNAVVLTATMAIDRAPQTITFETLLRRWLNVDPDFQLTASSSSGLPVVYDFSFMGASPAATVSTTGFVSLLEEGEILILASQAGNANYLPATTVLQTLEVYLENDTSLNVIVIEGNRFTDPGDETYYLIECNDDNDSVDVVIENDTRATFDPGASFTIATPAPGIYTQQLVVTADNGRDTRVYTIVVERRFDFDAIVEQKFNNTLVVNNNFDNNGGYEFVAYQWFKNGNMVSTEQSFSEGDNASDLLDPTAAYYVKMTTVQGDVLQTCISTVDLGAAFSLSVLENPVSFGRNLNLRADFPLAELEGAMYQIYTSAGRLIKTLPVQGFDSSVSLSPSLPVGLYRVVLATSQRTVSVNFIKN